MKQNDVSLNYIIELLELELKELLFSNHYILVPYDKIFYIACQLLFFLFYILNRTLTN